MAWNPFDEPIDYALILGKKTPGKLTIEGAGRVLKWDERAGYGYTGAWLFFKGAGLSHFTLKIDIWTPEQWNEWLEFKGILKPPNRARPRALDIWHPALELVDIKSIVVEEEPIAKKSDTGLYTIDIKVSQFRRPKLDLVKPEASEDQPDKGKDFIDAELERMAGNVRSQLAELAGEQ